MRIVVTGGAGFLGSHLCRRLAADGCQVVCIDNLSTGAFENVAELVASGAVQFVEADIADGPAVEGAVDKIVHLASPASPVDYLAMPLATLRAGSHGTLHALELARAKDARLVLASTSEVYGDSLVHPQPETYWGHVNPLGPRAVYDEAKRFAETLTTQFRASYGVSTGIARIFNTFGPGMRGRDGRAVPTFITQALRDEPITVAGSGAQTRSICYVDDIVDGLIRLMHSDEAGPFNLGNPHEVSMLQLAEQIRDLVGSRSPIVHVPLPTDDPRRRRPVIDKAGRLLGWAPRADIEKSLRTTIEWFRSRAAVRPNDAASRGLSCALIGLGTIGAPMARRLVEQGITLTTWSRSGRRITADVATDLPGAVVGRDVVLLSLADDAAVLEVVGRLVDARALGPGQIVVDTSTISPETARESAAAVGRVGATYLDAPISGGPSGAAGGKLTILVGGPDEAVRRVDPVLRTVGSNVLHVGEVGSGQVLKLCLQAAVAVQMNMIAQLTEVATEHGLSLNVLHSALSTSTARNHMAQTRFPVPGIVADSPASNGWRPDFSGLLMAKDVALAQHMLGGHRVDGLDPAAIALAAQIEDGHGDQDWSRAFS